MKKSKILLLTAMCAVSLGNYARSLDYDTECQQLYIGEGIAEANTEYKM